MVYNDFVGFEFNEHHSSELGIMRVSDGDRYNETLHPNFQDKTVDIPGGDGVYFFNSYYNNKPFNINIGFDSLTEVQLRNLRRIFNGKDVGWLIFDESPYKKYKVKVQSPIQLSYICFDEAPNVREGSSDGSSEIVHNHQLGSGGADPAASASAGETQRVYKGTGTIQFIAYQPFAHSVHKTKGQYVYVPDPVEHPDVTAAIPNIDEWQAASGILDAQGNYDGTGTEIKLYNPGDLEADFMAYYAVENLSGTLTLTLRSKGATIEQMNFENLVTLGNDTYIRINSRTNLVEGCVKGADNLFYPTGTLYNAYLVSGDFFKIPVYTDKDEELKLISNISCSGVEYDYLYY